MKHLPHILLPVFIGLLSSCTYHFELDDVGAFHSETFAGE